MENAPMLGLARSLGFRLRGSEQTVQEIALDLMSRYTARESGTASAAGRGAAR
jgi:hypothetical protein